MRAESVARCYHHLSFRKSCVLYCEIGVFLESKSTWRIGAFRNGVGFFDSNIGENGQHFKIHLRDDVVHFSVTDPVQVVGRTNIGLQLEPNLST